MTNWDVIPFGEDDGVGRFFSSAARMTARGRNRTLNQRCHSEAATLSENNQCGATFVDMMD